MRLAVRMMRQAISPRLAIRIFLNGGTSERDVVVLLPRVFEALAAQHRERAAQAPPRRVRHDDVVDEAARSGDEGVGEFLAIFLGAALDLLRVLEVAADDD